MPLIIVAGRPCVGKTTFAEKLKEYITSQGHANVTLVNEESLRISKADGYANSNKEKDIRGALKSAVDHALAPNAFVILDSLNYIKGFRYELYCQARTNRSTHCVVWVACDEDTAIQRNKERKEQGKDGYDDTILRELWKRFEVPIENNRWDRPLFKVSMRSESSVPTTSTAAAESVAPVNNEPALVAAPAANNEQPTTVFKSSWKPKSKKATEAASVAPTVASTLSASAPSVASVTNAVSSLTISGSTLEASDDFTTFQKSEEIFEPLLSHLTTSTTYVPNCSTVTPLHAQADMLYELDRTSQKILSMIIAHQTEAVEGTPIQLVEYDRAFTLHRHVSLSELQRFRRQFVKINAQHPPASSKEVGSSFVDFLASQL